MILAAHLVEASANASATERFSNRVRGVGNPSRYVAERGSSASAAFANLVADLEDLLQKDWGYRGPVSGPTGRPTA